MILDIIAGSILAVAYLSIGYFLYRTEKTNAENFISAKKRRKK